MGLTVRMLTLIAIAIMTVGGCCVNRTQCAGGACEPLGAAAGGCHSGCCGTLGGALTSALGCCSGCGDIYYDEWVSDPPDCCDPCDNCGNWVGPQHCCQPLRFLNPCNWLGVRYYDDDCGDCGACSLCLPTCDSCGGAGCDSCGGPVEGYIETINEPQPALPTPPSPPPAPATAKTRANQRPYYTQNDGSRSVVR